MSDASGTDTPKWTDEPRVTVESYADSMDRLRGYGVPKCDRGWTEFRPNYVEEQGFSLANVPALLELIRAAQAVDPDEEGSEALDSTSMHAWRVLGQLRATEAVGPLLDILNTAAANDNEWATDEFQYVFAMIGTAAIEPLKAFLADRSREFYARCPVLSALSCIAQSHSEVRQPIVDLFIRMLSEKTDFEPEMNGFAVCELIDLRATEATDVVEHAFAEDRVDEFIVGWDDFSEELGVAGTGIISDRPKPRTPLEALNRFFPESEKEELEPPDVFQGRDSSPGPERKKGEKRRKKSKRKQQSRSRRQNRRK